MIDSGVQFQGRRLTAGTLTLCGSTGAKCLMITLSVVYLSGPLDAKCENLHLSHGVESGSADSFICFVTFNHFLTLFYCYYVFYSFVLWPWLIIEKKLLVHN